MSKDTSKDISPQDRINRVKQDLNSLKEVLKESAGLTDKDRKDLDKIDASFNSFIDNNLGQQESVDYSDEGPMKIGVPVNVGNSKVIPAL